MHCIQIIGNYFSGCLTLQRWWIINVSTEEKFRFLPKISWFGLYPRQLCKAFFALTAHAFFISMRYYFRQVKVYLSYFLKWHYAFLLFHWTIGIHLSLTLQVYSTDQTFLLKVRCWIHLRYLKVFDLGDQIKQSNAEKLL